MEKKIFLDLATAAARESSATSKLPAGITVAQAALESAWGRSYLSRAAHNYFGIKAHGDHARIELPTIEIVNGREIKTRAAFARYASMAECFAGRDALILRSRHYAAARAALPDVELFTRELAKKWATDPHYAAKLLRIYQQHGLFQLDAKQESATDEHG